MAAVFTRHSLWNASSLSMFCASLDVGLKPFTTVATEWLLFPMGDEGSCTTIEWGRLVLVIMKILLGYIYNERRETSGLGCHEINR